MRVALLVALLLSFAASGNALEFAYYTSLRNDSQETIEITPDAMNGRSHYTVQPGETVTFLGGLSTQRFLIRTPEHIFRTNSRSVSVHSPPTSKAARNIL